MKRHLLLAALLLWPVACSKKKKKPQSQGKGYSLVKLFIKPKTALSPANVRKDCDTLVKRIKGASEYRDLAISHEKELHISLKVYNQMDKRQFLKLISPLLKYRGEVTLHEVKRWGELLGAKRPAPVHLHKLEGHTLFRSDSKSMLLDFLVPLAPTVRLRRVPKGVYDFSKSYWMAYLTGKQIPTTPVEGAPLTFAFSPEKNQKSVAVMLDSYILQLVKGSARRFTLKDPAKRLSRKHLLAIFSHGALSASWRIVRIEASQTL